MSEPWRPPEVNDTPPPCVRVVNPPLPVWVDVRKLLPKGPHDDYQHDSTGLELGYEIMGLLEQRIWRADGGWVGRVRFVLHTRDDRFTFGPWTALVPSHLLRLHRHGSTRVSHGGLDH